MDKIEKALRRLTPKERIKVKGVLGRLQFGGAGNLDVRKLKGREDIF